MLTITTRAVAELVWTGVMDDAFAIVKQPAHVRFLSEQCRLVGVATDTSDARNGSADDATSDGGALLRLRLEEIYVGLCEGFLVLQQTNDLPNVPSARDFSSELMCAVSQDDDDDTAASSSPMTLTAIHRLRLRVFRDLWLRGYFVAFGSKFSADFLIYEDAPTRAHATALVLVRPFDASFDCVDAVSHCRVATMVRKQLFFASQQTQEGEIVYVALNHALLATRQEL